MKKEKEMEIIKIRIRNGQAPFVVGRLAGEARTMRRIEDHQSTSHMNQPLNKLMLS